MGDWIGYVIVGVVLMALSLYIFLSVRNWNKEKKAVDAYWNSVDCLNEKDPYYTRKMKNKE